MHLVMLTRIFIISEGNRFAEKMKKFYIDLS